MVSELSLTLIHLLTLAPQVFLTPPIHILLGSHWVNLLFTLTMNLCFLDEISCSALVGILPLALLEVVGLLLCKLSRTDSEDLSLL